MSALRSPELDRAWTRLAAAYAIAGGTVTLLGWLLEVPRLTDWAGRGISMFPNPSVCAVLAGMALLLGPQRRAFTVRVFAFIVALIGGLTLFEHVSGIQVGIDRLLIDRPWGQRAAAAPMRMGPPASASFLMLGTALVLLTGQRRARRIAAALGTAVLGIAMLSITGYLYHADPMFQVPRLTGIALQTASILLAMAIGVIGSAAEHAPMRLLLGQGSAAMLARRTLPIVLLLPLMLGWLRLWGERHRFYDTGMGTAMLVLGVIASLCLVLAWAMAAIERREAESRRFEEERDALVRQLQAEQARLQDLLQLHQGAEEALREADRRKNEFLAMLSHELRNPLAPIRNAVQMLRLNADGLPEAARPVVAMMDRQVSHMVRLIEDLLDVSRITRGKVLLRHERMSLTGVVSHTIEAVRSVFQAQGQELTVQLPSDPIEMDGDPARLAQVVGNLLHNASKFTPRGGHASLTLERAGADAVIRVRDDGVGIPADQLDHIFELFAQVDTSLSRTQGGLGIGLTLAKTLIEMHGGRIEVRSAGPGRGSEFTVRLPVRFAAIAVPAATAGEPAATPRRILVVDDNHDSANSLATLLGLGGHEVLVAHDGIAAVEAAVESEPEVVLLDIGLPGLDGYEVARRIRACAGARKPLLIAITGWGQERHRREAEDSGFDAYLVKPVDHAALVALLADGRSAAVPARASGPPS